MDFILATGNPHKASEFSKLFDPNLIKVSAAPEKLEIEENGKTYSENAFLKAKGYFDKFNCPVLADDSGLNVNSLPDELGIYSARFGGSGLGDKERALLLLEKLADKTTREERGAHFSCVLCFYINHDEVFFFEGRLNGFVGLEYVGEHGFGYDPVFHAQGEHEERTVAEIPEWKEKNSHRAQACGFASKFFKERVCQTV